MEEEVFDISNKEAGFFVIAGVLGLVILMVIIFGLVTRYLSKQEPKILAELFTRTNFNFDNGKYKNNISMLLDYLRNLEINPTRHYEFGAVFALIAKNHLKLDHPAEAFYFSKVSEHYYGLFNVVVDANDETSTLIGNLRLENEKNDTQAGLLLTPVRQNEIVAKITSKQSRGNIVSSNDWLSSAPVSDFA